MWTAEIITVENNAQNATIQVEFTNDSMTRTHDFTISDPESLTTIIQDQLDQYNKIEDFVTKIQVGVVDTTPDQDKIDQEIFLADYKELQDLQNAIAQGFVKSDQAFIDLQVKVKQEFKPEYSSLI